MVPVTLSLKSKKASYRLYFDRRVSVIRGDSSSGKTLLCALLRSSKNNPKISVNSSAPVLVLDSYPVIDEALALLSGCVVFIDEDSELQSDTIFLSKILCIDAFFVFITRAAINTSYSIDSVFELTQNLNGEFENTKYYTNNVNRHRFRCAVVEDKKAGLDFYSMFLPCKTADGADNLAIFANTEEGKGKLYIFDSANFGRQYDSLYLLASAGEIELVHIESFESVLLHSPVYLDSKYRDMIEHPELNIRNEDKTWERYFARLIDTICMNEIGMHYSKAKLIKCPIEKCCSYGTQYRCALHHLSPRRTKLHRMLEFAGLDYLLDTAEETHISSTTVTKINF